MKDAHKANSRKDFQYGYRNREDVTTLNPNILVKGSKNVLISTYKRIGSRKGYTLDGQRSTPNSGYGIYGSYDWNTHLGTERNLRAGDNTTGTNGKIQFRYVAAAGDKYLTNTFTEGQVYWIDIYASAAATFNACRFWDFNNELKDLLLWVDGSSNVFMWSGGVTTVASATGTTITKSGGGTWASSGFLYGATYTRSVTINGTAYAYTGGADTDTLTGVTPDPSSEPVDSVVIQTPVVTANSAITGIPATFKNTLIENLKNQIYLTASDNNSVYVSKVNNFKDFSFASPRAVGEGAILTLDSVPTCLQQQSDSMWISAGKDYWYSTSFTLSSGNNLEALSITPIKTTENQACRSDALSTKVKNLIAFVSFETQVNTLGVAANYFDDPQVSDISYPIVHDVQSYDFTGGQLLYFQKYLFVTVPAEGVVLVYNMTSDMTDVQTGAHFWESPQIMPFGRLSIIGGDLYGHGYAETNTFKMFTGLSDDEKPYKCLALFAYDSAGDRSSTKSNDEFFIEGYKYQDTVLTGYLRREFNGPVSSWKWGTLPSPFITPPIDDASIGKVSIGKVSIGGTAYETDPTGTPPKFRLIQTYPKVPYFEEQVGFGSEGVGQWWEIASFSRNAQETLENQSSIKDPPLSTI